MLAPGHWIDRYELVCPLGEGGMAHVWAARHHGKHGFDKLVALKIIHSRLAEDPTFRAMFIEEARIVSRIEHRNVAQVFDLGESGSLLYLAMEYVDGDSLFALIAPQRTVPLPIALRITADACAGLHAVHELSDASGRPHDIVHRDVSPQNILLTMRGDVKLIDFGIALARDRVAMETEVGTVKGKVRYMAPEQARRDQVGPYTDVFAIGSVLFRMLLGRAPYAAEKPVETIQALVASAPAFWSLPASVPPDVAAIVARAIAPDVRDRYATAKALQQEIEGVLSAQAPLELGAWVDANLTERSHERRRAIAARIAGRPAATPPLEREPRPLAPPPPPTLAPRQHAVAPAPAPPTSDADGGPSFMDVGAIVARARPNPPGAEPNKHEASNRTPAPDGGTPTPRDAGHRELVRSAPAAKARSASGRLIRLAVATVALTLLGFIILALLPPIARKLAIARAREAGIDMRVERVGVGLDGITLVGVTAKVIAAPGITATVRRMHLGGPTSKEVRVDGLHATLEGARSDLDVALAALVADNRARLAGAPGSPRRLSIVGARLTWRRVAGEGSGLTASDIGAEIDSRGVSDFEIRGRVGRLDLETPRTTLGPWALSFESGPASARIRLMFDPPVPDGPSMLWVWGRDLPTELAVRIPRSPFAHLGIRPADLGLPADATAEVEARIEGRFAPHGRAEVKADVGLWGARPKAFKGPVDVRAEGTAVGEAGGPLEIERAVVRVGPFAAAVTGTIAPHGTGARVDATFKTLPLACAALARAEAKNMGPLVQVLQALGQTTGALRVTGSVNASGVVTYDTAEPEQAEVTWLTKETCGVSIFGL